MDLNPTKETVAERTAKENYEGGEAFEPDSPELGLYKVVVNNLLENKYYESGGESLEKLLERFEAVKDENPGFAAKLAAYARQEMYLRDVSQLLLVLAANNSETSQYVKTYAPQVIDRPDDACTAIAAQLNLFGKPIPKPLRKGTSDALHKFDAYQLGKYRREGREVSLYDVFNLVRPTPKDEATGKLWNRLMKGDLDDYPEIDPLTSPKTWEVTLTRVVEDTLPEEYLEAKERWKEQNSDSLAEAYGPWFRKASISDEEMYIDLEETEEGLFGTKYSLQDIQDLKREARKRGYRNILPKMGLFAKVRNLRNMLQAGIDGEEILGEEDLKHVRKSKMYPFRFYQAYRALKSSEKSDKHLQSWLERAIETSAENLPDDLANTFVAVDLSGSMNAPLSKRGETTYRELSSLFGAVLMRSGADVGVFAEDFERVTAHNETPILELTEKIHSMDVGGSTNGWKALQYLTQNDLNYPRIVFLTDMIIWDSTAWQNDKTVREEFDRYRESVNPETYLYMLDLSSYGDLSTPEGHPGVYNIQGWSDKVLDFIGYVENPEQVIRKIEDY